ncbi:MAG: polysaccharide lyase family 8 super-sandwich domain-containing protein [Prolixibacteraceae bacterium]
MKKLILSLVLILGCFSMTTTLAINSPDLEILRKRVTEEIMDQRMNSEQVKNLVASIQPDGSWSDINYKDLSRIGYENGRHLSNIWLMCAAYKIPSSPLAGDKELLKATAKAINFWTVNDFIAANWHSNEISNPQLLTHILLLMDKDLTEKQQADLSFLAQRANLDAWGARPGGDLVRICGIMAELALYKRDAQKLKIALETMAAQARITTGLGIKPDLGFHHRTDRVTSILTYGTGYASTLTDWAVRLTGTSFSLPAESLNLLIDYYLDGICKAMVYGRYKAPGLVNRDMSRKGDLGPVDSEIPEKLLMVSDHRKSELENIVKIRKGEQQPNLSYDRFFWHSEYSVHQRPSWYSTVRMFSSRNNTMEFPHNMESLKQHHYADGANFISVTGKEYDDIFSVWDWQKIPGTTVVQRPVMPSYTEIVKQGKTGFVGAVTDGSYGASAFDFESPLDPLKARKAWFFFDKEYVCLGAGITSSAEYPVTTSLNQCLLNGEVTVKTVNEKTTPEKGEHQLSKVKWVLHEGIAYVFPTPTDVLLNNKPYTGYWHDLVSTTRKINSDKETRELFSLWIDHGKQPADASYAYIVAPGTNPAVTDPDSISSRVKILVNTVKIQAVHHLGLNITQVVFYDQGTVQLSNGLTLTANNPGIVMLKGTAQSIEEITVADPGRKLHSFQLSVSENFSGGGANWKTVWKKQEKTTEITFTLPDGQLAGKSMTIKNRTFEPECAKKQPVLAREEHLVKGKPAKAGEHFVGESYGGGIVIWTDETGQHGLIAAKKDLPEEIQWRNGASKLARHFGDNGDRVVNARGDGIGAGAMNTAIIIAQLTDDDIFGNFAAKMAARYQADGYGDWYLPSKAELNILYQQKDMIGGFDKDMYWSSTELNVGFAWGQNFSGYGGQYNQNKSSAYAVRCVRKF